MRTIGLALLTALLGAAAATAQTPKPEKLPAPSPTPSAAPTVAPVPPAAPAPDCATCGGHCGDGCWGGHLLAFFTYRPCVLGAGCKCKCCGGHRPPLFAYFLKPCAETGVPGPACSSCSSCSSCRTGHTFLPLTTGLGFGGW
jgi:hypothetical protein